MINYINHMQDRNAYDLIIFHSGTSDVDKLNTSEIARNMEKCIGNLKLKWPHAQIAISGLTYVSREDIKNSAIDEINCYLEGLRENRNVTFINTLTSPIHLYGSEIW